MLVPHSSAKETYSSGPSKIPKVSTAKCHVMHSAVSQLQLAVFFSVAFCGNKPSGWKLIWCLFGWELEQSAFLQLVLWLLFTDEQSKLNLMLTLRQGVEWVGGQKIVILFFLIKLFVAFQCHHLLKSVEKIAMLCSNLFLSLRCLVVPILCLFFSFPVVFGLSSNEGGKKQKQQRGFLCVYSAHYCLSRLWFGKPVSAASHTFPFQQSIWNCNQTVSTPISYLSALCPCFLSIWTFTGPPWHLLLCFNRSTTGTKLLGATWSKSLWRGDEKKLYLATHGAINPVMVQLPLSKKSEGFPASHHTTLS